MKRFSFLIAGIALCLTGCLDAPSKAASATSKPVEIGAQKTVKRGVAVLDQAKAMASLSVIAERGDDITQRYRECRMDTAPAGFNCTDFLYALKVAVDQTDTAVMTRVTALIREIELLDRVPADKLDDEVIVTGRPVAVKKLKDKPE